MNVARNNITPMMAQYLEIKGRYPDALLFYRMGDFYEMFFDDAVSASAALDIALTKRGRHLGNDIPMCGVPVHASEGYLLSLIKKGFRVAVCEQLEDPKEARKRGHKAVVKRDVVRLVTPGTLTEDALLQARHNNYLAAFSEIRDSSAIAWADVSTGELRVTACPRTAVPAQLARLRPSELLVSSELECDMRALTGEAGIALAPLARASFDSAGAARELCAYYGVASLEGFGAFTLPEVSALGAILAYLHLTQKGQTPILHPPIRETRVGTVRIDAATRRNLELNERLGGGKHGSLLSAVDRTATATGARLLSRRLNSPSTDPDEIRPRLDAVSFYFDDPSLANDVRHALRACPDIERAISRLSLGRGGPRDLGAIRSALVQSDVIFRRHRDSTLPAMLRDALAALPEFSELLSLLKRALGDDLPVWARDGGFISRGYHAELDQMRELRDEGRSLIAELQAKYVDRSNISSLKIKNNNVLGYFVEVSSSHSDHMLGAEMAAHFIHRQTTASAVRFGTTELSELEARIRRSADLALDLERSIFADLVNSILAEGRRLSLASAALAEIDLAAALADLARAENWCRPEVDASRAFVIEGGRHPVVERALAQSADRAFVANDCDLSPETEDSACIWLLTGPNMAGKSTFLRQNAIIALLAQMGSFVPASRARIGVVTQLFSRVGASDDLARGRSTFMVEMVETAAILNQAEPGALVILDEIGRGTATYDGLSIAWATLEHLHDKNRCRTLFATHYHELTSLSSTLSGLTNTTITVREWQGDIVFLHEVHQGAADRSYGVQVARLAGLPPLVIERARHVLELLEKGDRGEKSLAASLVSDLPLFVASQSQVSTKSPEEKLASRLEGVHPDELSPIDALGLIYQLCEVLNES